MSPARVKWSTQVDPVALEELKGVARREGRQLQALVDEAVRDVIEKHKAAKPRPEVMALHRASMDRYSAVYKKLAE
jgi:hypothetical protein